jgi:hypothetical protein
LSSFLKGVLIMVLLPFVTGAQRLGVNPKTLHRWLKEADLPLQRHPTDARMKCVAEEHLQEVARRHGCPLPDLPSAPVLTTFSQPASSQEQALFQPHVSAGATSPGVSMPASSSDEVDLIQKVAALETKLVTLQEQIAQLALALLQERERTLEQRVVALEALIPSLMPRQIPSDPASQAPAAERPPQHQPLAVEQRAQSRLPALIEYSAQGTYVMMSSQEGEVFLQPDSPAWFAWLASIPSFRFVGQQGSFSAYRRSRASRSWRAYRAIHQRHYRQGLGVTDQLTIERLEHVATLFSDMAAL